MSAADVGTNRRRPVATAFLAGWFVLVAQLAAMFFVMSHKGAFAPEMGSSATFLVFAVLYSTSYIGGFVALWLYRLLGQRFGQYAYNIPVALCIFAAVVVASARTIAGPSSGRPYEFILALPAGLVASIAMFRRHRKHSGDADRE